MKHLISVPPISVPHFHSISGLPKTDWFVSSDPENKGTILGQEPHPGALVKAGRKITLKVSRGAILDRIENYIDNDKKLSSIIIILLLQ